LASSSAAISLRFVYCYAKGYRCGGVVLEEIQMGILKIGLAAATLAMVGVPAHANLEEVMWSGAQFGNDATAVGYFNIATDAAELGGVVTQRPLPSASFRLISLTVGGASSGNGTFTEADFDGYRFSSYSQLDFSTQLIGQVTTNGCAFGSFEPNCYGGGSGDFNLSGASVDAPDGNLYFLITTDGDVPGGGGDVMAVVSIAPAVLVPESSTWAMMLVGFAGVGFAGYRSTRSLATVSLRS
jgi:hypothetical protein